MEFKMTLKIKKYGEFLTSRPAGREAALTSLAYDIELKNTISLCIDFEGVVVMTPSWLSEFIQTLKEKGLTTITFSPSSNPTVTSSIEIIDSEIS
jgi:hypothetical protein